MRLIIFYLYFKSDLLFNYFYTKNISRSNAELSRPAKMCDFAVKCAAPQRRAALRGRT